MAAKIKRKLSYILPESIKNLARPLYFSILSVYERDGLTTRVTRFVIKIKRVLHLKISIVKRKFIWSLRRNSQISLAIKEYDYKKIGKLPDTFILYRILGNDLFPRHKKGQTRENLLFILKHEPEFKNCKKMWVLNRIFDKKEESAIIEILKHNDQQFIYIPFNAEEYKKTGLDTDCFNDKALFIRNNKIHTSEDMSRAITAAYRLKNIYAMNNNGARNIALRDGKTKAKWVLPWDGNCFVTKSAWDKIYSDVVASPHIKYFTVGMTRVTDNEILLRDDFVPNPVEEPQLIFRMDAKEEFNESFCYGRRPKVELFWYLGILGAWDEWHDYSWDQKRRSNSSEKYQYQTAGWVARLFSGSALLEMDGEKSFQDRGLVRQEAIVATLCNIDLSLFKDVTGPNRLASFRWDVLLKQKNLVKSDMHISKLIKTLVSEADTALTRKPYSVIDKLSLPPSGNANDYWHPAPYWWPNSKKSDGLPYIYKDGERVPGTVLYEPESEKYDRTRLQRVFDDSVILALAWWFSGKMDYATRGAQILERFFVDDETAMTPHLNYAQVRKGRNNNIGESSGIIEFKDMYFYLDAVKLFVDAGSVSKETLGKFKQWLAKYLEWLTKSSQGITERSSSNNHGTYYDLQVASIAYFIRDDNVLTETLIRAQTRIAQQFQADGSQPKELSRTTTAHYCCYNFQGWINLAEIASRCGVDLWSYKSPDGISLALGAKWLLSHKDIAWPYKQIDSFDKERFVPILIEYLHKSDEDIDVDDMYNTKPIFYPHDGIRPYWNLGYIRVKEELIHDFSVSK